MKVVGNFLFILFFCWGCATQEPKPHPSGLDVTEINANKWTALTKQNLLHLSQVYDLAPFLFTKKVHIESKVIPHSHPVLTLNTRYAEHPNRILSTFLHEELHWWLSKNQKTTDAAVKALKKMYPKAPVTKSMGANSTFIHLLVCELELRALTFYIGKTEARKILEHIMTKDKIYPWIYRQVLYRNDPIKKIVKKFKLAPPPLT